MKIERGRRGAKPMRQTEDVILFTAAGMRFAIAAQAVDEIRNLDGLKPYSAGFTPRLAKVKHTLVRENKDQNKVYFVVDTASHFQLPAAKGSRVLVLRQAAVAFFAEEIDRMAQISSVIELPRAFTGDERTWFRGLAVIEDQVVPVIDPRSLLSKGELVVLLAGWKAAQALAKGAASA